MYEYIYPIQKQQSTPIESNNASGQQCKFDDNHYDDHYDDANGGGGDVAATATSVCNPCNKPISDALVSQPIASTFQRDNLRLHRTNSCVQSDQAHYRTLWSSAQSSSCGKMWHSNRSNPSVPNWTLNTSTTNSRSVHSQLTSPPHQQMYSGNFLHPPYLTQSSRTSMISTTDCSSIFYLEPNRNSPLGHDNTFRIKDGVHSRSVASPILNSPNDYPVIPPKSDYVKMAIMANSQEVYSNTGPQYINSEVPREADIDDTSALATCEPKNLHCQLPIGIEPLPSVNRQLLTHNWVNSFNKNCDNQNLIKDDPRKSAKISTLQSSYIHGLEHIDNNFKECFNLSKIDRIRDKYDSNARSFITRIEMQVSHNQTKQMKQLDCQPMIEHETSAEKTFSSTEGDESRSTNDTREKFTRMNDQLFYNEFYSPGSKPRQTEPVAQLNMLCLLLKYLLVAMVVCIILATLTLTTLVVFHNLYLPNRASIQSGPVPINDKTISRNQTSVFDDSMFTTEPQKRFIFESNSRHNFA